LCPNASLALQISALFHDIERLVSESRQRVEQHAPDYVAFKLAHARAGAQVAERILVEAGAPDDLVHRVAELIAEHEQPSRDEELALLNEADGLSFFSLNASGFIRYYGIEHCRLKVRYTLRRLGNRGRAALMSFRHHPTVARLLAEELAPEPASSKVQASELAQ
jgi:hypothetical protein